MIAGFIITVVTVALAIGIVAIIGGSKRHHEAKKADRVFYNYRATKQRK